MQWIKPEVELPEPSEHVVGIWASGKWEQLQYSDGFGWTNYLSDWVEPPVLWCRIRQTAEVAIGMSPMAVTFLPNPERRDGSTLCVNTSDRILQMGEGNAEITTEVCTIHGQQPHIGGFVDGGYNSMAVCLKCCAEIYQALSAPA